VDAETPREIRTLEVIVLSSSGLGSSGEMTSDCPNISQIHIQEFTRGNHKYCIVYRATKRAQ